MTRVLGALSVVAIVGCGLLAAIWNSAEAEGQTTAFRAHRLAGTKNPDFNGIWQAMTTGNWDILDHAADAGPLHKVAGAWGVQPEGRGIVEGNQIPYKPEARAKQKNNFANRPRFDPQNPHDMGDPEAKCYMAGVPRAMYMPYPIQILQTGNQILMAFEYASASRIIHLKNHREAPVPSLNSLYHARPSWSLMRGYGDVPLSVFLFTVVAPRSILMKVPAVPLRIPGHRGARSLRPLSIAFVVAALGSMVPVAEAHVTRIVIDPALSETPAFEGRVFGPDGRVGPYEKLRGRAFGEVDPADPRNAVITDLKLAPRNARGKVEYSMDIFILKPIDLRRGNHKLFLDFNNRGVMRLGVLNDTALNNNPTAAAHAGTGFMMNLGYSIVGNGWDIGATRNNDGLTISVPLAKNADGTSVTGRSYEYINFDDAGSVRYRLAYPAASLAKSMATLTLRAHLDDQPTEVPASGWEYVDERTIRLLPAGTPFKQSHVYEFTYTAKDPVVAGLGLAATRDFVSFLRHAAKDDAGTPNPLAGDVRYTFSFSVSQPSRTLNDFVALGFNEDERGARVIDGMLKWTGGGSGDQINYRFAQTGRTERNRQHHLYPEGVFPFAYPMLTDHLSGRTGGRNVRCTMSNTCPQIFDANSSNEYWVKAGSLLHSDTRGNDLADPENVRFYLLSGLSHGVGSVTSMGTCQQLLNPTSPYPVLRALFTALDQWVTHGTQPPQSQVPRQADKTAVIAVPRPGYQTGRVPQGKLGWPAIPGVTYTGLITTRYGLDFGPMFDKGIMSNYPPSLVGRTAYPVLVSKVDQDGNEVAGIRLPPVEAPIATTTGWALRRAGFGENDGCEGSGQYVPFKTTKAQRLAAGDPRLSLEERYQDHDGYVAAVTKATKKLEEQRLLLPADVQQYIEQARASHVLR